MTAPTPRCLCPYALNRETGLVERLGTDPACPACMPRGAMTRTTTAPTPDDEATMKWCATYAVFGPDERYQCTGPRGHGDKHKYATHPDTTNERH